VKLGVVCSAIACEVLEDGGLDFGVETCGKITLNILGKFRNLFWGFFAEKFAQ
jgi:hypothetical protein